MFKSFQRFYQLTKLTSNHFPHANARFSFLNYGSTKSNLVFFIRSTSSKEIINVEDSKENSLTNANNGEIPLRKTAINPAFKSSKNDSFRDKENEAKEESEKVEKPKSTTKQKKSKVNEKPKSEEPRKEPEPVKEEPKSKEKTNKSKRKLFLFCDVPV